VVFGAVVPGMNVPSTSVSTFTVMAFATWSPKAIARAELDSCVRVTVQLSPVPLDVTRQISALVVEGFAPAGHTTTLNGTAGMIAPSPVVIVNVVPLDAGIGATAIREYPKFT
jgi:hypothetical protein